jgi:4-hydroxybenzoate polyprenyltransferase
VNDDREFEDLLRSSLDRRGAPAPFPVDVTRRVMARIAADPPPRRELGLKQLSVWVAAASVAIAALLAAFGSTLPTSTSLVSGVATAIDTMLKLWTPVAALGEAAHRVAGALYASAAATVRPLMPFQPLAQAMLIAIAALMLGITAYVVGRDVRNRVAE